MKLRSLLGLFLTVALLAMVGCGGGGDAPAPAPKVTAAVKLSTTGVPVTTPATLVGGIDVMLNYSSSKYTITETDVVASGAGAGSLAAANTNIPGQLRIGLISLTGFAGNAEFSTATFTLVPGKTPVPAADFTIAPVPAPVVSDNTASRTQIAGAGVAVNSVTVH